MFKSNRMATTSTHYKQALEIYAASLTSVASAASLASTALFPQRTAGTVLRFDVKVAVLGSISKIETQNYDF